MRDIEDCFRKKLLRKVEPSEKKAEKSLNLADSYLEEAKLVASAGAGRMSLSGAYMGWFHSARAVLFRDGIREKSHYCIELYLETYVESGHLEEDWILMLGRMRSQRHESQYSFAPQPDKEEVKAAIEGAEKFIGRIKKLLFETEKR
ncbi:MAG: HEPN domain-containing protein [Euryarchaeota archaeon]|nr:HEPN domain-containing protein [Euryarchaeota archaeon]